MLKVGLLVYPHCMPMGLFASRDFLMTANAVAGKKIFEVKMLGLTGKPVMCAHGQTVTPDLRTSEYSFDAVLIPGFWAYSSESVEWGLKENQETQKFVNSVSKRKAVYSYCTGTVFHAVTGRLDRKKATATWWISGDMKSKFPKTHWQFNKELAGVEGDITAAGANGFYPLMEHLVAEHAGKHILGKVQKYLMSPVQFNANDPFFELEAVSGRDLIGKIQRYVERSAARDINLTLVAKHLGVSTKTLSRKLKTEIKWTPALFFRKIKLKQAGELLLNSEESVKEVCDRLGFDDEAQFRKSFKKNAGMTPSEYKRKFGR